MCREHADLAPLCAHLLSHEEGIVLQLVSLEGLPQHGVEGLPGALGSTKRRHQEGCNQGDPVAKQYSSDGT